MKKRPGFKAMLIYLGLSLFTFVFGQIYTYFGHGVTSGNMTYAFVPTVIAALGFALCVFLPKLPTPRRFASLSLAFAVTCFTLDMITNGILDIAGAYSNYAVILPVTAYILITLFVVLYILDIIHTVKNERNSP